MSNPFYTFAPTFVPGSLARSGDVNTQFTMVQNAFDKVNSGQPGIGTDTGSVNAVVLTMSTTRTAYNNGDEFVFMPAIQNTGATTIKVDGLGVIPLVRFNGTPLQSGDLLPGTWYSGRYSSSLNSIEIASPAAYTGAAGIVSTGAPTHKVGLTAAGGTSINVLPVDATFAIDQSIAPVWTSLHTFNAGVAINAAARNVASLAQTAQSYGNTTDNPTYAFLGSGSFTVGGNISAANFTGLATPSGSIGLTAVAGSATTAARSDGTAALSQSIVPTWTGVHTWSNGSATPVLVIGPQTTVATFGGPNTGTGWNINFKDTTNGVFRGFIGVGSNTVGGAVVTDFAISPGVGGSVVIGTSNGTVIGTRFGPNGNVTINTPTSGNTLVLNTALTALAWTDGTRIGVLQASSTGVFTGSSTGDPFTLVTGGNSRVVISAAGNVTLNAPSSGVHTINTVGQSTALVIGIQSSGTQSGWMQFNDTTNANAVRGYIGSGSSLFTGAALGDFGIASATGILRFSGNAGSNTHLQIGSTGAVTINTPSATVAATINGAANSDAVLVQGSSTSGQSYGILIQAGSTSVDYSLQARNAAGTATYFQLRGDGVVQGNDGAATLIELGYKDAFINTQSGSYTLVVSDRGKTVQTGVTCTYTLNTGVFAGGAVVVLRVASGAVLTIAQGAGFTLSWAGNGSATGSRTLTGEGLATLLYTGSGAATISGAGLS